MVELPVRSDVAVVGAGAAGLATAIFTRREHPRLGVLLLDGSARPGAKILVSGGGRCNVTNTVVTEADFWGGKRTIVRRVLRALPVPQTIEFFASIGVPLHEEPGGKLFPDSNRARDVLAALLRTAGEAGVTLAAGVRVESIERRESGFVLKTSHGDVAAARIVLATGGRSLPKTGSDGGGYDIARALGHSLIAQTPALAPLLLDEHVVGSLHAQLSGVSQDVELTVWIDGSAAARLEGALLWTHFGISGPVVLNASRHWARARRDGRDVRVTLSVVPGVRFEAQDAEIVKAAQQKPRATVRGLLAASLPAAFTAALLDVLSIPADRTLAGLSRDDRRRIVHALTELPLAVTDTRGYNYAEVTAGGVSLDEIDPATMESRVCPGLFLVGEILDVDGRIGGFNFQWAWSSARAAAAGIGRLWDEGGRIRTPPVPR